MPFYKIHVDRVVSLIDEQELKLYWVADVAGIHKTTLRRWLNGRIQKIRGRNLNELAKVLERNPTEIAELFSEVNV